MRAGSPLLGIAAALGTAILVGLDVTRQTVLTEADLQGLAQTCASLPRGLALSGFEPDVWLYWLYALLPILVGFMSDIGALQITPDSPARVLINSRTGTIIGCPGS